MINRDFWKGKRVFLTGHTGFKGTWLCHWLTDLGAEVHGFALQPETTTNLFELTNIKSKMNSVLGDVRDFKELKKSIDGASPDIVIHMAAQPLVRRSYRDPIETFSTNVMGTVNLLEAARSQRSVKVIINVTTDKVYENKEWVWPYRETDRLGGFDPYSNSKACSELVTNSFRSSYFNDTQVKVVTARAGNVIGGGDWAEDRLVPDIIRSFEAKEAVKIRNKNAIRPWQHVLESLSGYLHLTEYLYKAGDNYLPAWNFGPGTGDFMTVGALVETVQKEVPGLGLKFELNAPTVHEAQILKLDNAQAREHLGWKNQWDYKTAIRQTFGWYAEYFSGKNPVDITLAQLREFEKCH